jgi:hypothetical protein
VVTGHIAVAFAARARWPRAELFALVVASAVPDLADFALPQGDQCRTTCELYTHACPAVLVLAAAMAAMAWAIWHRRITTELAGALVVVHVLCDMLTGYKKFWVGGPDMGLALYDRQGADFALEAFLMTAAWVLLRRMPNAPRWGTHPLTLLLLILLQAAFDAFQRWPGLLR